MGTNYYIKGYPVSAEDGTDFKISPDWHIGKTSAAGRFCFDCDTTLKVGGAERVHYDDEWYKECPKCGKPVDTFSSSFTFAMDFFKIATRLQEEFGETVKAFDEDEKTIVNEYGDEFSYMEFLELLRPIPTSLRFVHSLGREFS